MNDMENLFLKIIGIISIGSNVAVLIMVVKLTRYFTEMEFKVNEMWGYFQRSMDPRLNRRSNAR